MKIVLYSAICLSLLSPFAVTPAAASDLGMELSALEQTAFGKTKSDESIEARISSLEVMSFGAVKQGNADTRIQALKVFLLPELPAKEDSTSQASPVSLPDQSIKPRNSLKAGVSTTALVGSVDDQATGRFCGRWVGRLSGNDPNVSVVLDLHCNGTMLSGTFEWTASMSGVNIRALSGSYLPENGAVSLHDDRLVSESPKPGYQFCPIDKYDLRLSQDGNTMSGSYWSAACSDRGTFRVHKVAP